MQYTVVYIVLRISMCTARIVKQDSNSEAWYDKPKNKKKALLKPNTVLTMQEATLAFSSSKGKIGITT